MLERGNIILRDVDQWEADFAGLKMQRYRDYAKKYPQQLLDMWQASEKVLEKSPSEGEGSSKKEKAGKAAAAAAAAEGAGEAAAPKEAAPSKAEAADDSLSGFYEQSAASSSSRDESKGLAVASRVSSADQIGDLRSLDRAYAQRLVLLMRDKASG